MLSLLKSKVVWMSIAFLLLAIALPAAASGLHAGPAHGKGFFLRSLSMELDLSNEQKDALLGVLETYEDDILATTNNVASARQAFEARIRAEGFDETIVRQAYREELSQALEDVAVMRVEILSSVRDILTDDQIWQLEEKRAQRESHSNMGGIGMHRRGFMGGESQ